VATPTPFFTAKRQRTPCLTILTRYKHPPSHNWGWTIVATSRTCDNQQRELSLRGDICKWITQPSVPYFLRKWRLVFLVDAEKDFLGWYTLPTKYTRKVDKNFWINKNDFFIFLNLFLIKINIVMFLTGFYIIMW